MPKAAPPRVFAKLVMLLGQATIRDPDAGGMEGLFSNREGRGGDSSALLLALC